LSQDLVVAPAETPDPVKRIAAAARQHIHIGEKRVVLGGIGGERQCGGCSRRSIRHARTVVAEHLRKAARDLPAPCLGTDLTPGALLRLGGTQRLQPELDALGGLAVRIAPQVLLVLCLGVRELPGALARETEKLLGARPVRKLRLALQHGEQRNRFGVVVSVHRVARVREELFLLLGR